jgi:2-methylisocitrate lyase-like PEP mutase family enzyme
LSKIGVKRISVGSSLQRAALGAFLRAAEEMSAKGTFTYATQAASPKDVTPIFDSFLSGQR